jgi:hypothetical protein
MDDGVVGKGRELRSYGVLKGATVPAWEVGSSHAACEQRVPTEEMSWAEKADRPFAVPGRVQHAELKPRSGLNEVAVVEEPVGRRSMIVREPEEPATGQLAVRDEWRVEAMDHQWGTSRLEQRSRGSQMIEVAVREHDRSHRPIPDGVQQDAILIRRVYHEQRRVTAGAHEPAIGLEGPELQPLDEH